VYVCKEREREGGREMSTENQSLGKWSNLSSLLMCVYACVHVYTYIYIYKQFNMYSYVVHIHTHAFAGHQEFEEPYLEAVGDPSARLELGQPGRQASDGIVGLELHVSINIYVYVSRRIHAWVCYISVGTCMCGQALCK